MSVNHYLLPLSEAELASLLQSPETGRDLAERRCNDVRTLGPHGPAIVALTATGPADPLAFLSEGGPDGLCGWVGEYVVENGRAVSCQADMGYGPGSWYLNPFVREVAGKLREWTVERFAGNCDLDWLADHNVYPGGWTHEGSGELLLDAFATCRQCIIDTAESGLHLLVWCA